MIVAAAEVFSGDPGSRGRRLGLAFNALGAVLSVGAWAWVGYLAGGHITSIYNAVSRYSLYLLIALAVLVAALIIRAVIRRRRGASGTAR